MRMSTRNEDEYEALIEKFAALLADQIAAEFPSYHVDCEVVPSHLADEGIGISVAVSHGGEDAQASMVAAVEDVLSAID
jgi:hypothetical protein